MAGRDDTIPRGALIELRALLHHMNALEELPPDIVIPPRVVVTKESFAKIEELIKHPPKPTQAMRDLMAGKSVDGDP